LTTKTQKDFTSIFLLLKKVLKLYEKHLRIIVNKKDNYSLNAGYDENRKTDIYFGAVQIKKNYVSFHLMPVYVNPNLLNDISPELKKRMQGKYCFNFISIDNKLFKELSNLTKKGFEFYKQNGML
jgi:hypothetical protein